MLPQNAPLLMRYSANDPKFPANDRRAYRRDISTVWTWRNFILRFAMSDAILVRPIKETDFSAWLPLWSGYNAFYGRHGATALDPKITDSTWRRFFEPGEPVFALVAESDGKLSGLTHYLFHRDTTRIELTCYLQDLFTDPSERARGIGTALIRGVYEQARAAGIHCVYWQTHESNATGRRLYDKVSRHLGFLVYEQEL